MIYKAFFASANEFAVTGANEFANTYANTYDYNSQIHTTIIRESRYCGSLRHCRGLAI